MRRVNISMILIVFFFSALLIMLNAGYISFDQVEKSKPRDITLISQPSFIYFCEISCVEAKNTFEY